MNSDDNKLHDITITESDFDDIYNLKKLNANALKRIFLFIGSLQAFAECPYDVNESERIRIEEYLEFEGIRNNPVKESDFDDIYEVMEKHPMYVHPRGDAGLFERRYHRFTALMNKHAQSTHEFRSLELNTITSYLKYREVRDRPEEPL